MPRLLRALAHQSGRLTNFAQLAGQIRLDDKTARRYVGVFEQLFLVRRLEPWFRNPLKRLVKTPKLHFLDAGLLATLSGVTAERVARDRSLFGPILETFVVAEILRLATWSDTVPALYTYIVTRIRRRSTSCSRTTPARSSPSKSRPPPP